MTTRREPSLPALNPAPPERRGQMEVVMSIVNELTEAQNKAMNKWMRSRFFAVSVPHSSCFYRDGIEDARPIFAEIALRLERLAAMYREASAPAQSPQLPPNSPH